MRFNVNGPRRCLCTCARGGLSGRCPTAPLPFRIAFGALALGLRGERTGMGETALPPEGMEILGTSPVVRRRTCGRPGGAPDEYPPSKGPGSPPIPTLRAFSCLIWTVRKCDSSSCHLISSLAPILDRDERAATDVLYELVSIRKSFSKSRRTLWGQYEYIPSN